MLLTRKATSSAVPQNRASLAVARLSGALAGDHRPPHVPQALGRHASAPARSPRSCRSA